MLGWKLFALLASCFPPTQDFQNHLLLFLQQWHTAVRAAAVAASDPAAAAAAALSPMPTATQTTSRVMLLPPGQQLPNPVSFCLRDP